MAIEPLLGENSVPRGSRSSSVSNSCDQEEAVQFWKLIHDECFRFSKVEELIIPGPHRVRLDFTLLGGFTKEDETSECVMGMRCRECGLLTWGLATRRYGDWEVQWDVKGMRVYLAPTDWSQSI